MQKTWHSVSGFVSERSKLLKKKLEWVQELEGSGLPSPRGGKAGSQPRYRPRASGGRQPWLGQISAGEPRAGLCWSRGPWLPHVWVEALPWASSPPRRGSASPPDRARGLGPGPAEGRWRQGARSAPGRSRRRRELAPLPPGKAAPESGRSPRGKGRGGDTPRPGRPPSFPPAAAAAEGFSLRLRGSAAAILRLIPPTCRRPPRSPAPPAARSPPAGPARRGWAPARAWPPAHWARGGARQRRPPRGGGPGAGPAGCRAGCECRAGWGGPAGRPALPSPPLSFRASVPAASALERFSPWQSPNPLYVPLCGGAYQKLSR